MADSLPTLTTDKTWLKTLEYIKGHISAANYRIWFSPTSQDLASNGQLIINVPSAFIKNQLSTKYRSLIEEALINTLGEPLPVDFQVNPAKFRDRASKAADDGELFDFSPSTVDPTLFGLNPKYTLNSFMVGLSNNLAYAAAQAVVQSPGISYNPLFIYGGTGVGKTHLMQAVGNALLNKNPSIKIVYCSSEKFTNDFIQSIQNKRTGDFRAKYRACDLLLVDDIQFIPGRDSTQEEFFHTFNELHTKNAQIILTSDRPPHEMQKLEARLSSRFQGGLMVDIQIPDRDTRVAILRAKCQERGEVIPQECLELIAEKVVTNARELEGKLIGIIQGSKLNKEPVTIERVRSLLGEAVPDSSLQKPDPKKVINSINQFFSIKMSELTGPRRKKELVVPRQIAMFLLYKDCGLPYEKIGSLLGGRDHTTIMHGVEKIDQSQQRDREVQRLVIEVRQLIAS